MLFSLKIGVFRNIFFITFILHLEMKWTILRENIKLYEFIITSYWRREKITNKLFLQIPSKLQSRNWYCKSKTVKSVIKFYTASVDYCENVWLIWSFAIVNSASKYYFHLNLQNFCKKLHYQFSFSFELSNPTNTLCEILDYRHEDTFRRRVNYQIFIFVPTLFADNPRTWMFSNRP